MEGVEVRNRSLRESSVINPPKLRDADQHYFATTATGIAVLRLFPTVTKGEFIQEDIVDSLGRKYSTMRILSEWTYGQLQRFQPSRSHDTT